MLSAILLTTSFLVVALQAVAIICGLLHKSELIDPLREDRPRTLSRTRSRRASVRG